MTIEASFAADGTDDVTLVAAIEARDERALAEALRRHGPAVHGIARRLLGDDQRAQDLVQEVFVRLWRDPGRFDPARGRLRTMLLTQAHGMSVDTVRSENARRRREERIGAEAVGLLPDVDAELMALTAADQVRTALALLPYDERVAIELAYFGANTYQQVAQILGTPEGTIKTRIRSGLRRLRAALADADRSSGASAAEVAGSVSGARPPVPQSPVPQSPTPQPSAPRREERK